MQAKFTYQLALEKMEGSVIAAEEKFRLIANMQRYGGRFIYSLAQCMIAADPENFQRICIAFPEVIEKYTNWEKDS